VRRRVAELAQHRYAVAPGHADVHHDDVEARAPKRLQRSVPVRRRLDAVAGLREDVDQRLAHTEFVVGDQDVDAVHERASARTGALGIVIENVVPADR
jgi:hypothetical protein